MRANILSTQYFWLTDPTYDDALRGGPPVGELRGGGAGGGQYLTHLHGSQVQQATVRGQRCTRLSSAAVASARSASSALLQQNTNNWQIVVGIVIARICKSIKTHLLKLVEISKLRFRFIY